MELPTPTDLRERRKGLDLTQSELADAAEVSQPLIARIEGGDVDPRLSTLRRIVEALNEAEGEIKRAEDVMHEELEFVRMDDSVGRAIDIMGEQGYSQLPVVDERGTPVGLISNSDIRLHREDRDIEELPVAEVMNESYSTVGRDATLDSIDNLLELHDAVIVKEEGEMVGIITEADIATHLS
ncbi:CBS domain-containing protein [Haloarchaeobius amylolyticus]|uniref:CBS domain-containing protein n=1 Tax=Haloarchaeobius amylolyticus TaxID=1198296 RepID=UPI00226DF730|nr:CBS domain-containing protein [Haloarchaeobius amylolyticus]